jgi:transposase
MRQFKHAIGIDISKLTFDAAIIINGQKDSMRHRQFKKTKTGLGEFVQWLQPLGVTLNEETIICMEFTGVYNRMLLNFLENTSATIWVEMAVHIKRSLGLQRDKSDKLDAKRIALFCWRNSDEARVWGGIDKDAQKIKDLLAQRDRLVKYKSGLEKPLDEMEKEGLEDIAKELKANQKNVIRQIEASIEKIETTIAKIVGDNKLLGTKAKQVESIKGISHVICWHLIANTNGFECLKNGKALACYCGVAPFSKTSGTTVKGRPKVSNIANKKLKMLLHMAALCAIIHDPEMKKYYARKVAEGKHKMSVLNAVRNKLVLRIAAVQRDGREFEENYVNKAA